jgi:hypothetical protein
MRQASEVMVNSPTVLFMTSPFTDSQSAETINPNPAILLDRNGQLQ